MNRAFPQVAMEPVYGFCHYVITVFADAFFHGEYHGQEHLPRDSAFLIAANHASFMDPPFIGCRVRDKSRSSRGKPFGNRASLPGGSTRWERYPSIATADRT
ncbi:MAG: 1-acyl-sn-glycerol-3-phosphate acyltransferase [Opitutus sp.]|nr:1-acyl-sn-glycerol-3-phosphate acyltransferase [Opitutus sp.]